MRLQLSVPRSFRPLLSRCVMRATCVHPYREKSLGVTEAVVATVPDISNLANCIEETRLAAIEGDAGPADPTDYHLLRGSLWQSEECQAQDCRLCIRMQSLSPTPVRSTGSAARVSIRSCSRIPPAKEPPG